MKRLPGSIPRTRNAPPPGTEQVFSVVPQGDPACRSPAKTRPPERGSSPRRPWSLLLARRAQPPTSRSLVHPSEADEVVRPSRAGGVDDEFVGGRDAVVRLEDLPGVVEAAVRVAVG